MGISQGTLASRRTARGTREQLKDARADYALRMTQVAAKAPGAIDIIKLWDCIDGYQHFECHVSRARDGELMRLARDQFGHGRLKRISDDEWAVFVDAPQGGTPLGGPKHDYSFNQEAWDKASPRAQGNRNGLAGMEKHFGHNS